MNERRIAVILFNLGGPDSLGAVRPFLFNLFNDPDIITAPGFIRTPLAMLISTLRDKPAQANYAKMGGRSPLLEETQKQAAALDAALAARNIANAKCFIAMRHWRPFTRTAADEAAAWGASEALLLPLYPQFSQSTTGSSLAEWRRRSSLPARTLCCWPASEKFVAAHAEAILETWRNAGAPENPRVLFSAHGLPERAIAAGDPYQEHVEMTVAAVRARLPSDWDHAISYQSRVGPLKWIGPSTEEEIDRAIADRRGVIVSPIAFVSEHIETLVELDVDYAARAAPLPFYLRVPALGARALFIEALADLVALSLSRPPGIFSASGQRLCSAGRRLCPMVAA
ncbi:MAG: ferrochelatase [Hydrogenophilaceae bacterium]|jgi:ferrochelatase|nr:ferrochelatase [Hydrogenophilaceae bacterium]